MRCYKPESFGGIEPVSRANQAAALLAPEPVQLLALLGGQAVLATPVIAVGLANPVPDRLRRRLELLRVSPHTHHLDEPLLELGRVRWIGRGCRGLLISRKGVWCPR